MSLQNFAGKKSSCTIELVGGQKVEITFRPYTLADLAWMQEEFTTEADAHDIAALKATPISKIIWHQLDNESKAFFSDISFERFNDHTEEIEKVKLLGYQKLLHSWKDQDELLTAFTAYTTVENLNSFIPDEKKKVKNQKAA